MRRGSALLIVLGMLAFMVVSAVSFSMFMRQSRVPSSYLRREAAARYLLKSALANAIARLDGQLATERQIWEEGSAVNGYCEGVYDDSYPGIGPVQGASDNDDSGRNYNGDYWSHRVFTPFGHIDPAGTVSTLTLEGLAYLPPAIINEARVYSRRTRTAKWRNLAYDMGRYAFCAIDVSDCFDINKTLAGERRFSSPNSRVNLSSLFPDNGAALDTILHKWEESRIPFVSVADFNIMAEGSEQFAPFRRYIGTSGAGIYSAGDRLTVSNALFITDTWFPPTNSTLAAANRIDLSKEENQPFATYAARNFFDVDDARGKDTLYEALLKNLDVAGVACLYDYLDRDRMPISLALPTVETAPMICGLGLDFDEPRLSPKVELSTAGVPAPFQFTKVAGGVAHKFNRKIQSCVLKGVQAKISLSGTVVFPFKHVNSASGRKGDYEVETVAAVFFAKDGLRTRLDQNTPIHPKPEDWTQDRHVRDGVFWCRGTAQMKPLFNDNITREEDAVKQFVQTIDLSAGNLELPIYYQIEDTEVVEDDKIQPLPGYPRVFTTTDHVLQSGAESPLKVYDENGVLAPEWTKWYQGNAVRADFLTAEQLQGGQDQHEEKFDDSPSFRPYVAVWARIVDKSQSKMAGNAGVAVVDLVPATVLDDEAYLKGCSYGPERNIGQRASGGGSPVLDFEGDRAFSFKDGDILTKLDGTAVNFPGWQTLYAIDPRFNYAPEDWFATDGGADGGEAVPAQWLGHVRSFRTAHTGSDPDIFMFTSDQEQLQSIGELAFLPRLQEMTGKVNATAGEFFGADRYDGSRFDSRKSPSSNFANGWCMWQTYTPIGHNGSNEWDPIYTLSNGGTPLEIISGTGDFRVNPFSPDDRVMMAVVKDTPYDYFAACDNTEDESLNPTMDDAPTARAKWAFCRQSSVGAIWADDEMQAIAEAMADRFREHASKSTAVRWEDVFDKLGWYSGTGDDQLELFGVELDNPLHGVDRKYLYSFWRECFQNRQQLFLVFVRAEPLTVGGMGKGSLASAQLGARGVALVWRDPAPPTRNMNNRPTRSGLTSPSAFKDLYDNCGPHRTRVLFYHQFD